MTRRCKGFCSAGLLAAAPALASATPPSAAASPDLFELLVSLVLVLGLIVGGAWLAKRLKLLGGRSSGALRVVASLPLGPRERLLLVETGERRLLLGVSAAGIVTLDAAPGGAEAPGDAPSGAFMRQLEKETQRWAAGS